MALLPSPLAWTKKILSILKSNLSPNQIALAFVLGIFAGLPPMGLHILIPCSLALLVRCSFRSFLISMGLFKLLSLAVAPLAFATGKWLLDTSRGMDTFWRWLTHLPVLAPMGYTRYLLLGTVVLSFIAAVPTFFLVRLLVARYRSSFTAWVSGWRISRWLEGRRGIGLAKRFLAGGELKYITTTPPRGLFRVVRKEMLIGLPILYGLSYLLAAAVVPLFAGTLMTSTASWIVGSNVAVESSSFSLFTGNLDLTDFSVQDPKKPDENLVEIPSVTLDAAMLALLSKRVVFDNVVISDVSLHVIREEDGTLNLDNAESGWNVDGYLEWAARHAKDIDWLGLIRRFIQYLQETRPLAPREDPYASYAGGRAFPAFRAPFAVKRLEVGRVLVTLEDRLESGGPLPDLTLLEVQVENLAFPRELREEPITLGLRGVFADDPQSGFTILARFEEGEQPTRSFEISLTRIDLPRLARFYRTTLPVDLESGVATLTAHLELAKGEAIGNASLVLEELEIASRPEHPLFGLPPETSEHVVIGLNQYAKGLPLVIGFPIGGSSDAPTLAWEAPLLAIARDGLLMLGQRQLESTIGDLGLKIEQLGGVDPAALSPDYAALKEQAQGAALELIAQAGTDMLLDVLPQEQQSEAREDDAGPASPEPLLRLLQQLVDSQNPEE